MGQAEQIHTLSVDIYSCLYSTVQLPGARLASEEVSLKILDFFWIHRYTNTLMCLKSWFLNYKLGQAMPSSE